MSSAVKPLDAEDFKAGTLVSSTGSPNIPSNSVTNIRMTGVGMLSVGEKTMPTLRMSILLTSELVMTETRKAASALRRQ